MEFVYALINFALLAGVVYLFGRKKIAAIFRDRLARINSGLDLAEKPVPQPPAQEELPAPGAKLRSDELGAPARAAVRRCETPTP